MTSGRSTSDKLVSFLSDAYSMPSDTIGKWFVEKIAEGIAEGNQILQVELQAIHPISDHLSSMKLQCEIGQRYPTKNYKDN